MGHAAAAVHPVSRLEITRDTGHILYSPYEKSEEISSNTNAFHKVYNCLYETFLYMMDINNIREKTTSLVPSCVTSFATIHLYLQCSLMELPPIIYVAEYEWRRGEV